MNLDILIIEDNEHLARELTDYLDSPTFSQHVRTRRSVLSYADALSILATQRFDLTLLDVELNGDSGFELIEKLGTDHMGTVAFMTRYAIPPTIGALVGRPLFLTKPVTMEGLGKLLMALSIDHPGHGLKYRVPAQDKTDYFVNAEDIYLVASTDNPEHSTVSGIHRDSDRAFYHHSIKRVKWHEDHLPPALFCRASASVLFNIAHVEAVDKRRKRLLFDSKGFSTNYTEGYLPEIEKRVG